MNFKKIFISMFCLDLRGLAVMRILVSIIILWDLCATRSRFLTLFYTDEGALPRKVLLHFFANNTPLSLHMATGSTVGEAILLCLAGFFALNVLIGYRTRLFTFLSWLMLISLDNRNPFSMSEDFYLLIVLFWGMFLPWGSCLSVDSLNKYNGEKSGHSVSSWATTAYILQMVSFYISVGIMKHLGSIWNNGHALYLALNGMGTNSSLVGLLLNYPGFLSVMTKVILYMEMFVPLLFLVPFFNYAWRALALSCFILFHILIWLTLAVGYLSPVSIAALVGLMPSFVWDKIPEVFAGIDGLIYQLQQKLNITASVMEVHPWARYAARKAVLLCIIFFTVCNLSTTFSNIGLRIALPNRLHFFLRSIYFDHYWNMFSRLSNYKAWYLFEGTLRNGDKVNVLDGSPVDYNYPTATNNFFKEVEVQKFLQTGNPKLYGPYWGNYLCREARDPQGIMKFEKIRLIETVCPIRPYSKGLERKIVIFAYQCR